MKTFASGGIATSIAQRVLHDRQRIDLDEVARAEQGAYRTAVLAGGWARST